MEQTHLCYEGIERHAVRDRPAEICCALNYSPSWLYKWLQREDPANSTSRLLQRCLVSVCWETLAAERQEPCPSNLSYRCVSTAASGSWRCARRATRPSGPCAGRIRSSGPMSRSRSRALARGGLRQLSPGRRRATGCSTRGWRPPWMSGPVQAAAGT
jgi:hypothetical protein